MQNNAIWNECLCKNYGVVLLQSSNLTLGTTRNYHRVNKRSEKKMALGALDQDAMPLIVDSTVTPLRFHHQTQCILVKCAPDAIIPAIIYIKYRRRSAIKGLRTRCNLFYFCDPGAWCHCFLGIFMRMQSNAYSRSAFCNSSESWLYPKAVK